MSPDPRRDQVYDEAGRVVRRPVLIDLRQVIDTSRWEWGDWMLFVLLMGVMLLLTLYRIDIMLERYAVIQHGYPPPDIHIHLESPVGADPEAIVRGVLGREVPRSVP